MIGAKRKTANCGGLSEIRSGVLIRPAIAMHVNFLGPEPVSDIDTAVVDSLKVLDPNRPIREADIATFDALLLFEVPKNRRQGPATFGACAPRAALCEWGCLG
jgi:hypothetical protein